jgi:hypothetical protein
MLMGAARMALRVCGGPDGLLLHFYAVFVVKVE